VLQRDDAAGRGADDYTAVDHLQAVMDHCPPARARFFQPDVMLVNSVAVSAVLAEALRPL